MTELELAAIQAALQLLFQAMVTKKITPEDVTKQVQDLIWKVTREEV